MRFLADGIWQSSFLKLAWLRHCAGCGIWAARQSVFCADCEEKLLTNQTKAFVNAYPFPVFSLYAWTSHCGALTSVLLKSLKGGKQIDVFQRYALELLEAAPGSNKMRETSGKLVFVPAPSRRIGERDHAGELAYWLAYYSGGSYAPTLCRHGDGEQKTKKKKDRRSLDIQLINNNLDLAGQNVIFVDDVITTGSTAYAAYQALQRPQLYAVWTLFHRPERVCNK